MTHTQFTSALEQLGLTKAEFASLLGIEPRTVRRYATGDRAISPPIAIIIQLLLDGHIDPDDISNWRC